MTDLLFFCIIHLVEFKLLENERIKLIIRNIELLLNQLKIELQETPDDYVQKVAKTLSQDYDKIFAEE